MENKKIIITLTLLAIVSAVLINLAFSILGNYLGFFNIDVSNITCVGKGC